MFEPRANFGPQWPDAGTLPPGWPRRFADPNGQVFAAEEDPNVLRRALLAAELEKQGIPIPNAGDIDILAGALGEGGSPSDRPPIEQRIGAAPGGSGFRPRGGGFQPSPGVESGIVPARGVSPPEDEVPFNYDWHRNAALADIAFRRESQPGSTLGRGGTRYQQDMRPRPPKAEQPPVLPGGLNDIRSKYLTGNSPLDKQRALAGLLFGGGGGAKRPVAGDGMLSKDESDWIQANIQAEQAAKPAINSQEQNIFEAALGRGDNEQQATAKAQAFLDRLQRVNSTETHEQENRNRSSALMRHQEHQLFRQSPRAWAMWRMMGGGQGGGAPPDQAPPFGGNMGGAGMMAMMFGDPQMANFMGDLDRTNAQREQARGNMAVADMQHYREAMSRWEAVEMQRVGALADLREKVRADLTTQLGKPPAQDVLDAELRRRGPELINPVPRPIAPGGVAPRDGQAGAIQRVPRREELMPGGEVGGPTIASAKWADKLRTADRSKLQQFLVNNFDIINERPQDIELALVAAGIPKKAFIKAAFDAYPRQLSGEVPGATMWSIRDNRNRLRQFLLNFGVPPDVVPGEAGILWDSDAIDPAKRKAYYENLGK